MRRLPLAALLVLCLSTASAAATRTIGPGDNVQAAQAQLAGKDLACYCALGSPCHADVLLRWANGPAV